VPKRSIKKSNPGDFEPRKRNPISLGLDSNLDSDLKKIFIGNLESGLELSKTNLKLTSELLAESIFTDKLKTVNIDSITPSGVVNISQNGTTYGQFSVHHSASYLRLFEDGGASEDDYFDLGVKANGETVMSTTDTAGTNGHLKFEPDGSFLIKEAASAGADVAGYGQLWIKNNTANELWFTNDAGNDIPISLQPFIKTSQFQDDVGTTQHYIPFNNITEQSTNGTENVGFIAPFNMTLQKVAIKCSEDISGATIEVGMWAINDGSATNHHPVASQNNVDVTGGTAHTNAVADFTGTVGSGSSGSGGSNAISAGQFVDISIQLDSDETSSSAEWWVTCYFLADLVATI
tara:strand:- start:98 stop:1141 length:1044 start_codon:yes stop_codon:yes gene_type:complete